MNQNMADVDDKIRYSDESHDQLLQMVVELQFQNEFFKSQFEGFKTLQLDYDKSKAEANEQEIGEAKKLHERIDSLTKELHEEKLTRGAAEEALTHLREAFSEADANAQHLTTKLSQAQQKFDQEIKEREEKYADLDSKFSRLHKRAKQRIQEIQKEKDDLDIQFREVNETAERASSQQSTLQQELDRTRQQANEALKAMDAERQQLRSANNKLRDTIEELNRSLQPKENKIETLQQSLMDKEQMLEDMRGLFQAADEKRQAAITDLAAKHQKNVDSLEAQLADALMDGRRATETVSALQLLVAEKESKIAELEVASSGEAARQRAAAETVRGELVHLKEEHEKEKESWTASIQALKAKLETAESNCIRAEIEAAKLRSQLESDTSTQNYILSTKEAELRVTQEEIKRLESEFSSYKIRAHALLQKKDADLAAARDSEQIKALEEALKEAENEVSSVSSERDKAYQDLRNALANHDKDIEERDTAFSEAKHQIKSIELKLGSAIARHQSEKQVWEKDLQNLEEIWRNRCEALSVQYDASAEQDKKRELEELNLRYKQLKEEHDSLRSLADKMIEEKDQEISKLLDDNKNLQRSLDLRLAADKNDNHNTGSQKQDASIFGTAEQQILVLARQQAQREEELAQSQRHILVLQEEIEELERENRLHSQQEAMLKSELRDMERNQKREGVDMTYLKNVILKLLETGEVEALLPVVGMLLQFSPEEIQKCQQAYHSSSEVPATPESEASVGSLFSRFAFS